MRKVHAFLLSFLILELFHMPLHASVELPGQDTLRAWVRDMKTSPRGPFARIRWFCKDGSILPPKPYACAEHGGGRQHGEWTDRAKRMRAGGFYIGNVLAALDLEKVTEAPGYSDLYNQILIERFLISVDDGWILRKARHYRGAFQAEDERAGARRLLMGLLSRDIWIQRGLVPLRAGMRMLPHGLKTLFLSGVRQHSLALSRKDAGFMSLRIKIHNNPGPGDAQRVREYAANIKDPLLAVEFEGLASDIDKLYAPRPISQQLDELLRKLGRYPDLVRSLRKGIEILETAKDPGNRLVETGLLMAEIRGMLSRIEEPELRFAALSAGLTLETEHFKAAGTLKGRLKEASREERLHYLLGGVHALYGAGLISDRQLNDLKDTLGRMKQDAVSLDLYKSSLDYLALVPGWAIQWARFHFGESAKTMAKIEPLARRFTEDQLRGSPLKVYSDLLNDLILDANRLAGIRHELFGEEIGAGIRVLNPGFARGTLRLHLEGKPGGESDTAKCVYLLSETISDLPLVSGILTAGEGNPLSHVQLLARNLGIPNVAVNWSLIPRLAPYEGKKIILNVSPAGVVRLMIDNGQLDRVFPETEEPDILIRPDLEKLDLDTRNFIPLSSLRSSDSGRIVGPKAANLGELHHHYPEAVAGGLAIPFGVFRSILDRPVAGGGRTVFQWMEAKYTEIQSLPPGSMERKRERESFRRQLEQTILGVDLGEDFRNRLSAAMQEVFGKDGAYGVFVRSDTNVEDLPGFTGAGLNKTIPNVVGVENILAAIPKVWASPFSKRAFAWRQSKMELPQHVYSSVLLMRSVPSEKSGVLVTCDIDSENTDWLSVAVNEGVGGAVDGQSAESLRIHTTTGQVKMLAQATARWRKALRAGGGIEKKLATGTDAVLQPDEIRQLISLTRDLPQRYPAIRGADGNPVPADIEFGFAEGKLYLFQIRPFLESAWLRAHAHLSARGANKPAASTSPPVKLKERPISASSS